jgi:DNA-binding phage protein
MSAAEPRPTLREIKHTWPATCTVKQAASALGMSKSGLYKAIHEGSAPVKTIKVLSRMQVLTADLVRVLEA